MGIWIHLLAFVVYFTSRNGVFAQDSLLSAAADNFGPLTTEFAPIATSCFVPSIVGRINSEKVDYNFFSTEADIGCDFDYRSDCCPTRYNSGSSVKSFWSPGICPSGYTTASSRVLDGQVTEAICCPKYALSLRLYYCSLY